MHEGHHAEARSCTAGHLLEDKLPAGPASHTLLQTRITQTDRTDSRQRISQADMHAQIHTEGHANGQMIDYQSEASGDWAIKYSGYVVCRLWHAPFDAGGL